jgi:hypothetical protein
MVRAWITLAAILVGAGTAAAQDERDKKFDDLKREFERSMKALSEKFEQESARLKKEFKAAQERLLEKRAEPKGEEKKESPRSVEETLKLLLNKVEKLEKRLDGEVPKLRELPRLMPREPFREFEFKKFPDGLPDEWRKWLEQMPHFQEWRELIPNPKGEDFKFEFRKAPPKKEKKEKKEPEESVPF